MVDVVVTATDSAGNQTSATVQVTVEQSLQALIDGAPDGTPGNPTVITLPPGRYQTDQGLRIVDRSWLTIRAAGCETWTDRSSEDLGLASRPHIDIVRSTGITLTGIHVEGPNRYRDAKFPDFAAYRERTESDHAYAVRSGSTDILLEDCTFQDVWGDGVYVGFQNDGVANERVTVRRVSGVRCGRQGVALTHAVDTLLEDVEIDYGARSGLDIEPNHQNDKVWNVVLRRCRFGSKFYPFVISGASNGAVPQRRDVTLEDCATIRCPSNHAAVMANRTPCDGTLKIIRHRDERQSSIYGLNVPAWRTVEIEGCRVTTSRNTATSTAVVLHPEASGRIVNNDYTGKPGTEGFDQLHTPTTGSLVKSGNRWAMGTQTD